jgi:hypothetical protein
LKRTQTYLTLALSVLVGLSCTKNITDQPLGNQPPRSFLWLYPPPDSSVGVGVSRQRLHWWGEDPDGLVRGFLFSFSSFPHRVSTLPNPDTLRYSWVTRNDTLIAFPLDTLFREYTVFVRAVDNTFAGLPEHSIVRMTPFPYWDRNDNGVFDGSDEQLPTLPGAVDPVGAIETFPIRNTPPMIVFSQNPVDPTQPFRLPDTTFTVATFSWKGSDFDGDNTLAYYRIALNDTSPSSWFQIPIRDTVVTLVVPRARSDMAGTTVEADVYGGRFLGRQLLGTIPGLRLDALNTLFVEVFDVAGEASQRMTWPSGTSHWFVKRPKSKLLIASDYIRADAAAALAAYRTALAAVPGGEYADVDHLNLGSGLTAATKRLGRYGSFVQQFVDPALIHTFLLYDIVFWYSEEFPSLGIAQLSLFTYIQNGGKVVFSTMFESSADPRGALNDFAPIDSISSVNLLPPTFPGLGDVLIPANYVVFADSSDPSNIYPQLAFNATPPGGHFIFMRPIYRRSDARYIYHLQTDTRNRYIGMPNVGVVDGQRRIVFIGLPLHLLNNNVAGSGMNAFFTKVLIQELSPHHRVDRRIF